jgi:hypothetical protein
MSCVESAEKASMLPLVVGTMAMLEVTGSVVWHSAWRRQVGFLRRPTTSGSSANLQAARSRSKHRPARSMEVRKSWCAWARQAFHRRPRPPRVSRARQGSDRVERQSTGGRRGEVAVHVEDHIGGIRDKDGDVSAAAGGHDGRVGGDRSSRRVERGNGWLRLSRRPGGKVSPGWRAARR